MKRFLTNILMVCFACVISIFITNPVYADGEVLTLDFKQSASGEGWYYDVNTNVLTLDGYTLTMPEDEFAEISLENFPEGFTVHLADGSVNTVTYFSAYGENENDIMKITGNGTLHYTGGTFSDLQLESGNIIMDGCFYGCKLIINGGNAKINRLKAISYLEINGGDVIIPEIDAYSMKITGGNVRANEFHNCNGTSFEVGDYSVTGGSLRIDITEPAGWNGIVYYNSYDDGTDMSDEIKASLDEMGTMSDGNGNPVFWKVEPSDEEVWAFESTFVDCDGNPATTILIQPKSYKFLDLVTDAYYVNPVIWAVGNGITSGTSDYAFDPDENCTRGQVATFLWRSEKSPEPTSQENPFVDVASSDYFYKPVLWAVENKITSGATSTAFDPNASCTRGQAVTFLWRCAGKPKAENPNNPFTDVTEDYYYYDAVQWAVEEGITSGTSATTFSPEDTCTRGQIVTFLYRYCN